MIINKYKSLGLACASALASLLSLTSMSHAEDKVYRIALSNSFIGNQWRVQMVNITNAYAKKYYKDKVKLTVVSSGPDVQAQIAAIDDMISQKVDAILVDPASSAALNPVIEEAAKQGIVVVNFDQSVAAPSAYKVGIDLEKFGSKFAQFLADTLKGKGDLINVRSFPGSPADAGEYKGEMKVLAKYPDMHIVAEVYGKVDDGVTQAELLKVLPAHPKIDGIINTSNEGAVLALQALHRPFVPMSAEASNGIRLAMLKYRDQGLNVISCGGSPATGAYALKIAVDVLEGHGPASKDIDLPIPCVTSDELKVGVNVFPDLPATVYDDLDIPDSGLQPITMQDSLGK